MKITSTKKPKIANRTRTTSNYEETVQTERTSYQLHAEIQSSEEHK